MLYIYRSVHLIPMWLKMQIFKWIIERVISLILSHEPPSKNQADASLLLTSTLIILVVSNLFTLELELCLPLKWYWCDDRLYITRKRGNPYNIVMQWLAPCTSQTEENIHLTSSTFVIWSIFFSVFAAYIKLTKTAYFWVWKKVFKIFRWKISIEYHVYDIIDNDWSKYIYCFQKLKKCLIEYKNLYYLF